MNNKFQEKLVADGYCDSRGAGFCASAVTLPNGEYGLVAVCVKGNIFTVYDFDIKGNFGDILYEVELKKVENLKIKTGFFNQVLKFDYNGARYSFTNFLLVKPALKVIEEEANKK